MENTMLKKTMDAFGNVTKIAANLSEAKKAVDNPAPPRPMSSDDSNNAQTGNQSVNIKVERESKKEPKPIEKHSHEFPENRPLTSEECELALKKAQMDYELKKSEQTHFEKVDDREWQHRLEVEKKNERKGKIRRVVAGILCAIGAGAVGYSVYTDYRNGKFKAATPKLQADATVKAEGEVK